ncbi:hypothetical protein C1H87_11955 [Flavivirga eckloniae]|uniref:GP-PDE domain-containing protein n=1 Tax=Flavivirga eckloniae TaxID=1803846 RepID=A0A2K9PX00_9FLAO|nr:hypothetical protein C1H87_11955 [Flavivirga eckloniae]
MEYIAHRINTIKELNELPESFGVEIDLRDDLNGNIYISHDPFVSGELFERYLKAYKHGTMILNVKSERIEGEILCLLKKYNIQKYFFLDSSFPMIYLLSKKGEENIAIRFSEFEGLDTVRAMQGKVKWIWVDCFTKLPLNFKIFKELKSMGYKLCLVSPELQGRESDILTYKDYLKRERITFDAICTKYKNVVKWEV